MASILATLITSRKCQLNHIPDPLILYPESEVSIGRSSKADLAFPDIKQISHVHCYVRNRAGIVEVKSVSTNRTFVCGKAIGKETWHRLRDGDTLCLSQAPKVKIEVRIGAEVNIKGKRKSARRGDSSIAEIRTPKRPNFEFFVVPPGSDSNKVSVTLGRSKDCDVVVDDKRISSTHCKLVFTRIEGESVHWNLQVECVSKNKTYLGSELIDDFRRITPFDEPITLCFVFPEGEKPVETFIITPIIDDSSSPEPLTASDMIRQELEKEEKRQKKEMHHLEKRSKEWESQYRLEIEKLQDTEHELLGEIEKIERLVKAKRADMESLRATVHKEESKIKRTQAPAKST